MIRTVISTVGIAAEVAVYRFDGYFAGYLAATALVATAVEVAGGSPIRKLVDRLIGAHLPESLSVGDNATKEGARFDA